MYAQKLTALKHLGIGLFLGAFFGGLSHLWFLHETALTAVHHSGEDPRYWGVKPLGETFQAYFALYFLALLAFLYILVVSVLARAIVDIERLRNDSPRPPRRPWSPPSQMLLAVPLLGAGSASGVNLWLVNGEYRELLACGERYAVATAATALPNMYALTAGYCGLLLTLSAGGTLLQRVRLRQRVA